MQSLNPSIERKMISVSFISTINKNEFIKVRLKFYKSYRKWTKSLSLSGHHTHEETVIFETNLNISLKPLCLLKNYNRNKKIIKYNKQLNDYVFTVLIDYFFHFVSLQVRRTVFEKWKLIFFWRKNEISIRIWGILLIQWGNRNIWN